MPCLKSILFDFFISYDLFPGPSWAWQCLHQHKANCKKSHFYVVNFISMNNMYCEVTKIHCSIIIVNCYFEYFSSQYSTQKIDL